MPRCLPFRLFRRTGSSHPESGEGLPFPHLPPSLVPTGRAPVTGQPPIFRVPRWAMARTEPLPPPTVFTLGQLTGYRVGPR